MIRSAASPHDFQDSSTRTRVGTQTSGKPMSACSSISELATENTLGARRAPRRCRSGVNALWFTDGLKCFRPGHAKPHDNHVHLIEDNMTKNTLAAFSLCLLFHSTLTAQDTSPRRSLVTDEPQEMVGKPKGAPDYVAEPNRPTVSTWR